MARIIKSDAAPRSAPAVRAPHMVGVGKKVVAREVFSAGNKAEAIFSEAAAAVEARRQRAAEDAEAAAAEARDRQARESQVAAVTQILGAYLQRGERLAAARDQCLKVANTLVFKITGQALSLPPAVTFPMVDAALKQRRGKFKATLDLTAEDAERLHAIEGLDAALEAAPEIALVADGGNVLRVAAGEMPVDARMAAQALCSVLGLQLPPSLAEPTAEPDAPSGDDAAANPEDAAEDASASGDAQQADADASGGSMEEATSFGADDAPSDDAGGRDSAEDGGADADGGAAFSDPADDADFPEVDAASGDPDPSTGEPSNPAVNPADFSDDDDTSTNVPPRPVLSPPPPPERSTIRAMPGRAAPLPPMPSASAPRVDGTRVESLPAAPRAVRITDEPSVSQRVRPMPFPTPEERSASRARPLPSPPREDTSGGATMAISPAMIAEVRRQLPNAAPPAPRRPAPPPPPTPTDNSTRVDVRALQDLDPASRKPR